MQLKLAKIILSTIFILFHSSRSEFCHEAHGLIYNDQILIGGNYKSIITRGILVCSHKCLADPACTSYNYERSTESQGACELINEEAESTEVLQERKGSFFVRLRQKVVSYFSKVCYYEMPLCTWRFWNRGGSTQASLHGEAPPWVLTPYPFLLTEKTYSWPTLDLCISAFNCCKYTVF